MGSSQTSATGHRTLSHMKGSHQSEASAQGKEPDAILYKKEFASLMQFEIPEFFFFQNFSLPLLNLEL